MTKKAIAFPAAAAALLGAVILSFFITEYSLQLRAVGVLGACLILWISEAMPISLSSL